MNLMVQLSAEVWGDVASWISAIGTAGALLIAMLLLRIESKERLAQRESMKRNVARKISGWCEVNNDHAVLWIQNLSDEPVYYVVGYIGKQWTNLEDLPDDDNEYIETVYGTVPPGTKLDYRIEDVKYFKRGLFPDIPEVAIEFTDANGLHWRRLSNGKLIHLVCRRPFD